MLGNTSMISLTAFKNSSVTFGGKSRAKSFSNTCWIQSFIFDKSPSNSTFLSCKNPESTSGNTKSGLNISMRVSKLKPMKYESPKLFRHSFFQSFKPLLLKHIPQDFSFTYYLRLQLKISIYIRNSNKAMRKIKKLRHVQH